MLRSRFHTAAVRDEYIALDNDVRAFFGSGAVVRLDYPRSFDEAGWLRGPPKDAPWLYRNDGDGSLLLARDTREAVAHLTRVLVRDPAAPARVHLDGLRGRTVEDFGAPRAGLGGGLLLPAVALGILAILCIAVTVLAVRGRRRT